MYWSYVDYDPNSPAADELGSCIVTLSEAEILDCYWTFWYDRMCEKFGKEHVDANYSSIDCIDDWAAIHWAWESTREGERLVSL